MTIDQVDHQAAPDSVSIPARSLFAIELLKAIVLQYQAVILQYQVTTSQYQAIILQYKVIAF
jgi:hypothetical protein